MTDDPKQSPAPEEKPEGEKKLPPQRQRPKMSLEEQSIFLSGILRRCVMHSGDMKGYFAGEALLTLTTDDMLKLETVQQTLAVFEIHRADELVRQKIYARRR